MRVVRVNLKIDDRIVQFAGELADLLIETVVTRLVQFVNQAYRLTETTFLKAVDKLRGVLLQGRFEFAQM